MLCQVFAEALSYLCSKHDVYGQRFIQKIHLDSGHDSEVWKDYPSGISSMDVNMESMSDCKKI